ncbi:hypothetical protein [Rhizocola hellebori]|nr:hypothetical protein [Rhizocola hellebori]
MDKRRLGTNRFGGYLERVTLHMIYDGAPVADSHVSRTGGIPLVTADFVWPTCAKCKGAMQFIVQLLPDDVSELERSLLVFMCQNDPGMCDDWNPRSGANKSYLFPVGELRAAQVPAEGVTTLSAVSGMRLEGEAPADAHVIGRVGGKPEWIQADETPGCPKCGDYMDFLVQLQQGHDHTTAVNFGGDGLGYAFVCKPCQEAAFVWQC